MPKVDVNTTFNSGVIARARYQFRVMAAGVAFWAAIALPFVYIPLLLTGLNKPSTEEAFFVLILTHIGSLVLGHQYPRL